MSTIDCVVVGFLDDSAPEEQIQMASQPEALSALLSSTYSYRDRRYNLNGLLSAAIEEVTGQPFRLHVARTPNLAGVYLASCLTRQSLNVGLVNFVDVERERLIALLQQVPRAAALTTTFYSNPEKLVRLVRLVRQWSPQTRTIVGGPFIHRYWSAETSRERLDWMLRLIDADIYIVDSQGEGTLGKVCAALRDGTSLGVIPNVIFRDGGEYRRASQPMNTAEVPADAPHAAHAGIYGVTSGCDALWRVVECNGMDENHVDWRLFDAEFVSPLVQTRTSRGCAFQCAFCSYSSAAGPLQLRSLASIQKELDCLQDMGVRFLVFNDDTLNVPLARFKDMCRLLAEPKYGFQWFSFFRAANCDDETFGLMKQAGCTAVAVGIESGDPTILTNMNKHATVEQYAYAMQKLHDHNIRTFASFIVGFPGETAATLANTLRFIEMAKPDFFEAEAFVCEPGTPVVRQAWKFGLMGNATCWTHATMNSRQATYYRNEFVRTLMAAGHVWCEASGFWIWGYAYLLSLGFSQAQVDAILRLASQMNLEGQQVRRPRYSQDYEQQLADVIRAAVPNLRLDPPPEAGRIRASAQCACGN
jgi:radical SAM superfamily enzyme YgiQ (UPF0313 family)